MDWEFGVSRSNHYIYIWAFLDFDYNADKTQFTRNTKIFASSFTKAQVSGVGQK